MSTFAEHGGEQATHLLPRRPDETGQAADPIFVLAHAGMAELGGIKALGRPGISKPTRGRTMLSIRVVRPQTETYSTYKHPFPSILRQYRCSRRGC
jgi:hypothetical protein